MKRPKLEYYGKPKMTDEGVETFVPVKDIMRFVKDLEEYCDQLELENKNSDIHSVSNCSCENRSDNWYDNDTNRCFDCDKVIKESYS